MTGNNQNNQNKKPEISQEELDYLYSLYKSSQAGNITMTKEDIKKIVENERFQKVKVAAKKGKSSDLGITGLLWKQTEMDLVDKIGKEEWDKIPVITKQQLTYLYFIKLYGMDIFTVNKFIKKITD